MVSGIYWSRGGRSVNEDSLALEEVCTNRGTSCMAVVSDGIATLDYGEVVSGYVVECMVKWFYRYGVHMKYASRRRIKRSLLRVVYDCHTQLRAASEKENIQWGATCSFICIWGRRYVSMNIGDSCVLTMWKKMSHGRSNMKITSFDVNEKGELMKAICSQRYNTPGIQFGNLHGKWAVLVASDGFIKSMSPKELCKALEMQGNITPERIEHRLASIGNENQNNGEKDNQSAILVIGV